MVRVVNSTLLATTPRALTPAQRRTAQRKLARLARSNPLRTIRLSCHEGPQRDAVAPVGDLIWCEKCPDNATEVSVRE